MGRSFTSARVQLRLGLWGSRAEPASGCQQHCRLERALWEELPLWGQGVLPPRDLQGNRKPPEGPTNKQEEAIFSFLSRLPARLLWRPLTGGCRQSWNVIGPSIAKRGEKEKENCSMLLLGKIVYSKGGQCLSSQNHQNYVTLIKIAVS